MGAAKRLIAIAGTGMLAIGWLWAATQPWEIVNRLMFGPPPPETATGWTLYAPLAAPRSPWPLDPLSAMRLQIAAGVFFVAVPLAVILYRRVAERRASVTDPPFLWAIGAAALAILGIVVTWVLQRQQDGVVLRDSYYVVFHAHTMIRVCAMFGLFAGFYYGFPRITGLATNAVLGQAHFWLTFAGIVSSAYVPFAAVSLGETPRRFADYGEGAFETVHLITRAGLWSAAAGTLCFLLVIVEALWRRQRVAAA